MTATDTVFLVWPAIAVLMLWCYRADPTRQRSVVYIPQPCPLCGWEDCQCERSSQR